MWFAADAYAFDRHNSALPIDISADALEVLQKEQKAVFAGNVIARQGEITLTSDRMTVTYAKEQKASGNAISKLEVEGHVFFASPGESASGDVGVYDVNQKIISLLGNVVLTKGKNVLKGERMDYNLASGRSVVKGAGGVTASGQPKSGRVRGLFVPEKSKDAP